MKLEIDYKKKTERKKKKPHRFVVKQHATEQPWIKEQIKRNIKKYLKKSFGVDFYKPVSFVKQNEEGKSYNERFVDVFQDNEKIAVLSYSGKSVSLNFTDNALSPIKFKSSNAMNLMNWWAVSADRLQDFMYVGDKDNDGIPYQKEFEFFKKVNNASVSKRQA